jgi:multiple sugar transport system ATP-binding protein
VIIGVRPEHLLIGTGQVEATIIAIEWLGHERHVVCDLAGAQVTIREGSSAAARTEGDRVRVTAAPEHVHLFSPDTTERLN